MHTAFRKETDAAEFLFVPKHSILIPVCGYTQSALIYFLTKVGDMHSPQDLADYPTISDKHRRLHFPNMEILPVVRKVTITKQGARCTKTDAEIKAAWNKPFNMKPKSSMPKQTNLIDINFDLGI